MKQSGWLVRVRFCALHSCRFRSGGISAALLLTLALTASSGFADDNETAKRAEEIRQQLEALTREIEEFKAVLNKTQDERTQIENELKHNETDMSDLLKKIRAIETELEQGEEKLDTLKDDQKELNDAKLEQQGYIIEQIRQAFALGQQENLKVLLSQEDPLEITRMLTYYDYFNRARAEQIIRYEEVLDSLARVQANISLQTEDLRADRSRLKARETELAETRLTRSATLARLNAAIQSRGTAIEKMTLDRGDLENLLDAIDMELARLPDVQDLTPFPKLKGKMTLPVKGSIANRFGSGRVENRILWQGIFIAAEEGATVHAIHHGRVVFSDWLRGFGLMMIINHGDGYMSLYGHNQTLEREAGDWVATDEVISTAGNTGGLDRFGLYFEIRQSGQPRNPETWCLARA